MDDFTAPTRHRLLPVKTQRTLQIILGLFWLLDAGLQFQPYMFGHQFVNTFILANATGQPPGAGWLITHVGHFLAPDSAVWNFFFALVQVLIGGGLLFKRTVRPALAVSFAWALGVWFFGEGMGMVFTGTATALTGAPGSVLMYALIGLMAWPRASQRTDFSEVDAPTGVASSAAGRGIGGAVTPLAVWTGFWILAAVLFVLPENRTQSSVSSAIIGMAPGNPSWFSHFLTSLGHQFTSDGTETAWILAVLSLIIAFGPLIVRRPQVFLLFGGLMAFAMWVAGQGLVGGVFTGSGTDPNTGPLVVLLALAMVPLVTADRAQTRPPLASLLRWNPIVTWGAVLVTGAAMAVSATYPVAAQETTGMAMAGMRGMASMSSGTGADATASTESCSSGNGGIARTGLNLSNTPMMMMTGTLGMNMNGSDASAAAGINSTKANWHYTGPALPAALAQELLSDGGNSADDLHMAETGCAHQPTASEEINAIQYVQATSEHVAQFDNPLAALAAGYQPVSPIDYPVTYFINPTIVAANEAAQRTLSPQHIDGLVYAKTPSGTEVLAAAMYLLPYTVGKAPMPYGPLVQWHQRTDVCAPLVGGTTLDITGWPPCSNGSTSRATPYMTLVWQIPVAGGPLAIQPPDIQIVEAATMDVASS
jgi:hypothetical protein